MAPQQQQREIMQRSVDSLERLFAVVVALAITVAIHKVLFDSNSQQINWH